MKKMIRLSEKVKKRVLIAMSILALSLASLSACSGSTKANNNDNVVETVEVTKNSITINVVKGDIVVGVNEKIKLRDLVKSISSKKDIKEIEITMKGSGYSSLLTVSDANAEEVEETETVETAEVVLTDEVAETESKESEVAESKETEGSKLSDDVVIPDKVLSFSKRGTFRVWVIVTDIDGGSAEVEFTFVVESSKVDSKDEESSKKEDGKGKDKEDKKDEGSKDDGVKETEKEEDKKPTSKPETNKPSSGGDKVEETQKPSSDGNNSGSSSQKPSSGENSGGSNVKPPTSETEKPKPSVPETSKPTKPETEAPKPSVPETEKPVPETSKPTKPETEAPKPEVHKHNYTTPVTEDQGYYEDIIVEHYYYVCHGCGVAFSDYDGAFVPHAESEAGFFNGCGGWTGKYVNEVVGQEWVENIVTVGYKCSCGDIKYN